MKRKNSDKNCNEGTTFDFRGVVEGFYGKPWSFDDRKSIIKFMGEHNMNTYLYAPKDDAKHRELWRELYTDEEKEDFCSLISCSQESNVHFVYAISPGLDYDFGDKYMIEKEKLIAKLDSMVTLGVRHFALLLDDIPDRSAKNAFNHAKLVNDFRAEFFQKHPDLPELICIFTEYFDGYITEEYTYTVAKHINKDVIIMWTGPSLDIQMPSNGFDKPNALYGRKMLLWWNYPANDYCPENLTTDAAQGLSPALPNAIRGILSNPMNQAEAAKIPLFTLSAYLENPVAYDAKESFEKAIKELHPKTFRSIKYFCEVTFDSQINYYTDSVKLKELLSKFEVDHTSQDLAFEMEELKNVIEDIRENDENKKFVEEITPWLEKASLIVRASEFFFEAINATDEQKFWDFFRLFIIEIEKYNQNNTAVSKRVLQPFFTERAVQILSAYGPNKRNDSKNQQIEKRIEQEKCIPSASLSCYQEHIIENVTFDDSTKFYWSNGAASKGFWIKLTFEKVTRVHNIVLKSGCSPSGMDYIQKGQMQFSIDDENWIDIGSEQSTKDVVFSGLDLECRYLRYLSKTDLYYWMSCSFFAVNVNVESKNVFGKPYGTVGHEAVNMLDADYSKYYKSERSPQPGERITILIPDNTAEEVIVLQSTICSAEVFLVSDEEEIKLGDLQEYYNIFIFPECKDKKELIFKWNNDIIPEINAILFR